VLATVHTAGPSQLGLGEARMPFQGLAVIVLERWRAVERSMQDPAVGEEALDALRAEAAALRDEYQRLVIEARAKSRPEPPPFPSRGTAT
jgi:hypothetical protein